MKENFIKNEGSEIKDTKERFLGKRRNTVIAILLVITITTGIFAFISLNSIYGNDLMRGITPNTVEGKGADDKFSKAVIDFSIELFKRGQTKGVNSLISPLSVYISLAMVANGADGETRAQFEEVLGDGISIDELNAYVYSMIKNLPDEGDAIVDIVNSIWLDNSVKPFDEFLQKNADYYGTGMYKADLSSGGTIDRINNWIEENTEGLIDKVIEEVDPDAAMYLINTLIFDEEWSNKVFRNTSNEKEMGPFYTEDGEMVEVEYMSAAGFQYIENDEATGFVYKYKNVENKRNFSFVAILPRYDIPVNEYVNGLTGDEFSELVDFESPQNCEVAMPKFKYEYSVDLKNAIADMGLSNVTNKDKSDLSQMGKFKDNPYIGKVAQNTTIEVNEEGTKAGAATVIEIPTLSASDKFNRIVLNRPFLYAIVDNETKIPFFMGTVSDFEGEKTEATEIPKGVYREQIGDFLVSIDDYKRLIIKKYLGNEKEVIIPGELLEGGYVAGIAIDAFKGNKTVEKITIEGKSVSFVDNGAFSDCPNLKELHVNSSVWYVGEKIFTGSENVTVYFHYDFGDLYRVAVDEGVKVNIEDLKRHDDEGISGTEETTE